MARAQRFLAPPQMLTKPGDACHRCSLMSQVQEPFSNVAIFLVVGFGCCERWRCVRECRKGRTKGFCSDPPNCCQHGQQGMCLGTSYPEAVANSFVAIYSPRSFTRWSMIMRKSWSTTFITTIALRIHVEVKQQEYGGSRMLCCVSDNAIQRHGGRQLFAAVKSYHYIML